MNEEIDGIEKNEKVLGRTDLNIPFCGCLSIQYYRPYFDIDTIEVFDRMLNSVSYCRRDQTFLSLIGDRPDAYGPFWIATSLVFTVAVGSHINGWISSWMTGSNWQYNFQSILTASSVIYSYAGIAPAVIWGVFKQYEKNLKFITILCLYGYSLISFIPAILLCLIPFWMVSWVALLGAAVISGMFLLKNLAPVIVNNAKNHAAILLGLVALIQLTLMFSMKVYFF